MVNIMEKLYSQYYLKLFSFVNSRIQNKEDTEDIVSEIFIKIYKHIDTLDSNEKLTSWIFTITRNSIIDFYRKTNKYKNNIEYQEELYFTQQEQQSTIRELSNCIEPIINSLTKKYKEPLYLFQINGLKQKEIAKKLNISQSNIKNTIFRGKKQIKEKLYQCCSYEYDSVGNIIEFKEKGNRCNFC